MNILVACEFSGVVREAFNAYHGNRAVSCDLLPPEDGRTDCHLQGDALNVLHAQRWDLVIAHPPCTFLCNSGVRWLYGGKGKTIDGARWAEMEKSARFFLSFFTEYRGPLCVENPIMHGHARKLIGEPPGSVRQTVQPWQFGHAETKATVLWLRGLPPLAPTKIVSGREPRVHHASPGPERWRERSRTLPGIAQAMAAQWTQHLTA